MHIDTWPDIYHPLAIWIAIWTFLIKSILHGRSLKYWTDFIWVPKLRNRTFCSLMYLSDLI